MDWQTQEVDHKVTLSRNSGIMCWQTSCSCNGIFIIINALFDLLSMTFDKQYISHANGIFNVKQNIQHIQITRWIYLMNLFSTINITSYALYMQRTLLVFTIQKGCVDDCKYCSNTLRRNMHKINLNNKNLRNHCVAGKYLPTLI